MTAPFTDRDIEIMRDDPGYKWGDFQTRPDFDALLARLEAAEAFIREYENTVPDYRYRKDLLEAWRKAASK